MKYMVTRVQLKKPPNESGQLLSGIVGEGMDQKYFAIMIADSVPVANFVQALRDTADKLENDFVK